MNERDWDTDSGVPARASWRCAPAAQQREVTGRPTPLRSTHAYLAFTSFEKPTVLERQR